MSQTYRRISTLLIAALLCYCYVVEGGEAPEEDSCISGESWLTLIKIFLTETCGHENCCITGKKWEGWTTLAKAFLPAIRKIPGKQEEKAEEKRFGKFDWYGKK